MMRKITLFFAFLMLIFACATLSASAISKAAQRLVDFTDRSVAVESTAVSYDSLMKINIKTAKSISESFGAKTDRVKALALSDDEIEKASSRLSKSAKIQRVTLEDGRKTYFISLDLQNDDAVYLYNPLVLRKTSEKLLVRTEKLKGKRTDVYLMDYTHIAGELKLHFMGYNATRNLKVENSKGLLGKVYRSCSVSDINIDEDRFPVMIRWYGIVAG